MANTNADFRYSGLGLRLGNTEEPARLRIPNRRLSILADLQNDSPSYGVGEKAMTKARIAKLGIRDSEVEGRVEHKG